MKAVSFLNILRSPYAIIAMIVGGSILLLLILFFIYKKVLKPKMPKIKEKLKAKLQGNRFKKLFKKFRKSLPWNLRHAVYNRKYYLYLNAAGDQMVARGTNVSSYSYDYYSDYAVDDDYIFYLTSNVFIHEMKRNLILDNTTDTNQMLAKFCKKSFAYQTPVIIVSLDYRELAQPSTESSVELQLALRKKLIMLEAVCRSKPKVFVTIANCNEISGFSHFTDYLFLSNYHHYALADEKEKKTA